MLEITGLLTILDSVAKSVDILATAFGVEGIETDSISAGAAANRYLLETYPVTDVQADLVPAFARRAEMVRAGKVYVVLQGAMLQRALDRHYGFQGVGDLNGFLKWADARVHPNLKLIGMQIDSGNVFMPDIVDPVAVYEGTGAGVGTFTIGSTIDTTQYGNTQFEVFIYQMGGSARTVRLHLKHFDETTETRDVVLPANAESGTVIDVPGRYVAVTNIETIGGGGGPYDVIRIRSVVERVIAL